MTDRLPNELAVLNEAHQALTQAETLEEVKVLRDKAEAARKFAQCAKLGLEKQNQFAEFKLTCERKAGRLLIELGLRPGRPRKKKRSHHGTILAKLGINKNQSSRWQQEARVSEELLDLYITTATLEGKEITAQGLLRMARQQQVVSRLDGNGVVKMQRRRKDRVAISALSSSRRGDNSVPVEAVDLVVEVLNHHKLLSDNLREFCEQEAVQPKLVQRRTVARVLNESRESLTTLLEMLRARPSKPDGAVRRE